MATNTLYADLNELTCVLSGSGCDFTPITADDCNEVADAVAAAVEAAQLKLRAGSAAERHAAYIDDVTTTAAYAAATAAARSSDADASTAAAAAGSIVLGVYVVNECTLNEELIKDVKKLNIRLYTHRGTLTGGKQNNHDNDITIKMDQGKRDGLDLKLRFEALDSSIHRLADPINKLCYFYNANKANITFKECRWTNTIGRWQKAIEQYREETIGAFQHPNVLPSDLQSPADYVMIYQVLGGDRRIYELPIPVSCKSSVKLTKADLTIKNLGVPSSLAYATKGNAVSIFGSIFGGGDLADYVVTEVRTLIRVDNEGNAITDAKAKSELIDPSVEHPKEDMTAIGECLIRSGVRDIVDPRDEYIDFVKDFCENVANPRISPDSANKCIEDAWKRARENKLQMNGMSMEDAKMIMFDKVRKKVIENFKKCWEIDGGGSGGDGSYMVDINIMKQFLRSMLDIRKMEYLKIDANGPPDRGGTVKYSCINENTLNEYIPLTATGKTINVYFVLVKPNKLQAAGPTFLIYIPDTDKTLSFRIKCASSVGSSLKVDVKSIKGIAAKKHFRAQQDAQEALQHASTAGRTKNGGASNVHTDSTDTFGSNTGMGGATATTPRSTKRKKGGVIVLEDLELEDQEKLSELEDELRSIISSMPSSHNKVCPVVPKAPQSNIAPTRRRGAVVSKDDALRRRRDAMTSKRNKDTKVNMIRNRNITKIRHLLAEVDDEDYNEELDNITKYWFPILFTNSAIDKTDITKFRKESEAYFSGIDPWTAAAPTDDAAAAAAADRRAAANPAAAAAYVRAVLGRASAASLAADDDEMAGASLAAPTDDADAAAVADRRAAANPAAEHVRAVLDEEPMGASLAADDVEMTGASLADDDDKMAVGGKKTIKYKKVRKSRKKALPHRRKTHRRKTQNRKTHRRKTKKPKKTRRKKKN